MYNIPDVNRLPFPVWNPEWGGQPSTEANIDIGSTVWPQGSASSSLVGRATTFSPIDAMEVDEDTTAVLRLCSAVENGDYTEAERLVSEGVSYGTLVDRGGEQVSPIALVITDIQDDVKREKLLTSALVHFGSNLSENQAKVILSRTSKFTDLAVYGVPERLITTILTSTSQTINTKMLERLFRAVLRRGGLSNEAVERIARKGAKDLLFDPEECPHNIPDLVAAFGTPLDFFLLRQQQGLDVNVTGPGRSFGALLDAAEAFDNYPMLQALDVLGGPTENRAQNGA